MNHIYENSDKIGGIGGNVKFKLTRLWEAIKLSEDNALKQYLQSIEKGLSTLQFNNPERFQHTYEEYAELSKKLIELDHAIQSVAKQSWEPTPSFHINEQNVVGIKNRVAVRFFEDTPPTAGKPVEVTWYLWGHEDVLFGNFQVVAVSEETTEKITLVHDYTDYDDIISTREADHTVSREIVFPYNGRWRLNIYVGHRLYGQMVVDVAENG